MKYPLSQFKHEALETAPVAMLNVPGEHPVQAMEEDIRPEPVAYVPAGQSWHVPELMAPDAVENPPALH